MYKFNISFTSHRLMRRLTPYLAAAATVAMVALTASVWQGRANAQLQPEQPEPGLLAIDNRAQVAELDQLLADFHGALSYGGNITAMMSLWADDSSITLNGVAYNGKAAVQAFFLAGGYFKNHWVSLAPEYKTQVTVNGPTAEATTQCVAIDVDPASSTFHHVVSIIQINKATAVRHEGKWLFTSMDNTAPAPL